METTIFSQVKAMFRSVSGVLRKQDKRIAEIERRDGLIVKSSTPGSTKRFLLSVDDTGTITATEI